jgi:two-component sensor histidine kinase
MNFRTFSSVVGITRGGCPGPCDFERERLGPCLGRTPFPPKLRHLVLRGHRHCERLQPVTALRLAISLPARSKQLRRARRRVVTIAGEQGATQAVCEDVGLCVHEAVVNVIQHGYLQGEGRVEIGVGCDGNELMVVVRDWGRGFDGEPPRDGLGLRIINRCTKQYAIAPAPDRGTEAVMLFDLTGTEDASAGSRR